LSKAHARSRERLRFTHGELEIVKISCTRIQANAFFNMFKMCVLQRFFYFTIGKMIFDVLNMAQR